MNRIVYLAVLLSFMSVFVKAQGLETLHPSLNLGDTLSASSEERSYQVRHYWDDFVFPDSLQYMNDPEKTEESIRVYINLLNSSPATVAVESITDVMDKADSSLNGLFFFYNAFEKYLYDLSSPLRNETLFIPVLKKMISSDRLGSNDKIRPEMLLASVSKNMIGSSAADFEYTLSDGTVHRMSALSSPFTFLLFFDPDCDDCHRLIKELQSAGWLNELIASGRLLMLAVYPGENVSLWKTMQSNMPGNWIIGYDAAGDIYKKELYDILGFPTLFLLDSAKMVILKDASLDSIKEYFK